MSGPVPESEQPANSPDPGLPPKPPPEEQNDPVRTWTLAGIMLALAVWGLYHTLGVFLYNHDPRKAAIVFGCSAAFLVIWAALLYFRPPRQRDPET